MNLLITNDDGIYSPGILALARVAAKFGHVRIVAPDVEQSAMSAAITSTRPLSYRRTPLGDFEAFRVERYAVGLRGARHPPVGTRRRRAVRDQPGTERGQRHLAFGDGLGRSPERAAWMSRNRVQYAGDGRGAALRHARAFCRARARAPAAGYVIAAGERERAATARRRRLDAGVGPPVRRLGRAGQGSAGPRSFLVHGQAARAGR